MLTPPFQWKAANFIAGSHFRACFAVEHSPYYPVTDTFLPIFSGQIFLSHGLGLLPTALQLLPVSSFISEYTPTTCILFCRSQGRTSEITDLLWPFMV